VPLPTHAKPGRKVDYDWDAIEEETYRLLDLNGDFTPARKNWSVQARLEDALLEFCDGKLGREPSPAALRRKMPEWLGLWRARQRPAQAAE